MPPRLGARLGRLSAAIVAFALVGSAFLLAGCGSRPVSGSSAGPVAYVTTVAGRAHPGNTLALVDTATSKALKSVATGSLPAAMAATPDGAHLLVADKGDNQLTEITMSTGKVTRQLTVGLEPDAVAVTPDGSLALVANFGDNTITPVSLPSFKAGPPIPVGHQPVAVTISPNGKMAVVANYQDGTVTPIGLPRLLPMAPLPAGPEPDAVLIGPDNSTALVADFETTAVTAIDLSTMTVRKIIPVAGNPTGIALWKSTMIAYVSGGNSVTPLDLLHLDAGTPFPVGTTAQALALALALALADNGRTAWVCGGNATLVPMNLVSGAIGKAVNVGGQPTAVVIPAPPTTRTPPGAGS